MNGSAICFGALLGGYLAAHLPPIFGQKLFTLFLISGLLRGLIAATTLRRISEVRYLPEVDTASDLLLQLNLAKIKTSLEPDLNLRAEADKVNSGEHTGETLESAKSDHAPPL